jgi:hypothetical protein
MNQAELQQLLDDIREIKRALVGDTKWGEPGLIKDVKSLQKWRQSVTMKVAFYSGVGTTVVLLLNKTFEWLSLNHK